MLPIWFVFHCILNWFVVGQKTVSALYQLCHSLQVDGLIKLMNGNKTGPINLGNPGKFNLCFRMYIPVVTKLGPIFFSSSKWL
jgi:hypothetical protein